MLILTKSFSCVFLVKFWVESESKNRCTVPLVLFNLISFHLLIFFYIFLFIFFPIGSDISKLFFGCFPVKFWLECGGENQGILFHFFYYYFFFSFSNSFFFPIGSDISKLLFRPFSG